MNSLLFLIGLRAAALSVSLGGQTKLAGSLYLLADAIEQGRATEAHLKEIAAKLNSREIGDSDLDDVVARIEADSGRLQSHTP